MDGVNGMHEAMALLALSHTPAEHRLYETLLAEAARAPVGEEPSLDSRRLLALAGLNSYSTLRRARAGLIAKLSIECHRDGGDRAGDANAQAQADSLYQVYQPSEVFARRRAAGLEPFPKEYRQHAAHAGFAGAIERVAGGYNLSRREAQVALCCAEGLTNCEIGAKLFITEQTVKFHLRHIFVKFGVRRRTELVSRLLCTSESSARSLVALSGAAAMTTESF